MTTLVCGLPGSGKTTWAMHHITDDTLVYDLDAIAGAFRLKEAHEEYHQGARKMANDLLLGFLHKANEYAEDLIIIRTAPSIEELERISPDRVIVCTERYTHRPMEDEPSAVARIDAVIEYCHEYAINAHRIMNK